MPISYRTDVAAVVEQSNRQGALEAAQQAYIAQAEVARLTALHKKATGPAKEALKGQLDGAKEAHGAAARRAGRKHAQTPVAEGELKETQRSFLETWLAGIEREHAVHTAQRAERQAAVAVTGANAMSAAEKEAAQGRIAENEAALVVLESAHEVCVAKLDALLAGKPDPTA